MDAFKWALDTKSCRSSSISSNSFYGPFMVVDTNQRRDKRNSNRTMYPTSPRTVQGTTLSKPPIRFASGRVTAVAPALWGGSGATPPPRQKRMVERLRLTFRRAVNRRGAGARAYYENRLRLRRAANPVASGPGTLSTLACDYRCSVIYRCSENKKDA